MSGRDDEPAALRLLVGDERHGNRLAGWVDSRPSLRVTDRVADADLCIADPPGLRESLEEVATGQREAEGWLPLLLVVPAKREATPERLEAFEADHDVHIDATVSAPLRDATLSRQVETLLRSAGLARELSETEERYRALVDLSPEAILVLREGAISYANEAARELLGDGPLTGASLGSFVVPDDRDTAAAALAHPDGTFRSVRVATGDGRSVPCELAAAAVREADEPAVQVVLRDVSERVRNEERLRLYQRAMDDAQQGIVIADADADDLPIIYANEAFERITGYPCEEVVGRNCRFLQGPGTDSETVAEIRSALAAEEPVAVEILNYRRDGTAFWNRLQVTPIRDETGDVTHYIGLQRDITEQKYRFQRLSVLDRVLRHNIRNKTNIIAGYTADIEMGEADDPVPAARAAREAAIDLLSISEAAREFHAAMNDDGRTVRDLSAVVEAAVTETRAEYPGEGDITVDAQPAYALVTPAVELAVEELLTNAIEHSDRDTPTVDVSVVDDDPWVVVRVADDGPGIPDSVIRVIDSPGETPTEHLGRIGLWLVRWAVRGGGGELAFEANEPRGTVVELRLPRAGPVDGTDTD